MNRFLLLAFCLPLLACRSKANSFPTYEQFAQMLMKGAFDEARKYAIDGIEFSSSEKGGTAPALSGKVTHLPIYNDGVLAWDRRLIEDVKVQEDGSVELLNIKQEICRMADNADAPSCKTPNTYRHHVMMRKVGSDWKVAGLSEETIFLVR
jgi:hypothetical protein